MKKVRIIFILLVFLAFNANASMISFYVIETGLSENAVRQQHSILWENAFMDVFFDAGFIVSNAPILRMEKKPAGDILASAAISLNDMRELGIDFIMITQLDYISDSQAPVDISFYIYMITPEEKLLLEKQIKRNSNKVVREEFNELKTIARGFIPFFN